MLLDQACQNILAKHVSTLEISLGLLPIRRCEQSMGSIQAIECSERVYSLSSFFCLSAQKVKLFQKIQFFENIIENPGKYFGNNFHNKNSK
jgi:hypothetical protein